MVGNLQVLWTVCVLLLVTRSLADPVKGQEATDEQEFKDQPNARRSVNEQRRFDNVNDSPGSPPAVGEIADTTA